MRALELHASTLIIVSVLAVSILGWLVPPLRRALTLVPYRVREKGEVWRILTAGWVHGGVGHLVVNVFSLFVFSGSSERVLGETPFVALYISSVALAFVPSTLGNMHRPGYATLGASGAVSAVMFSAILLNPGLRVMPFLLPIPVPALLFAAGYLAYSAWQATVADSEVNHGAHLAGAIYGAMFTYAFEPARVQATVGGIFAGRF